MGIDTRKFFTENDKIVNIQQTKVTKPLWSNNDASLVGPGYTNEMLTSSSDYYLTVANYYTDIFHANPLTDGEIQFSVSYIHSAGSGSSDQYKKETKALFTQAKNILGYGESDFLWNNIGESGDQRPIEGLPIQDAFLLSVNKDRYLCGIDPCAFEIKIGSYTFIARDMNDDNLNLPDSVDIENRVDIVSGSLNDGPYLDPLRKVSVGWLFPKQGIALINPRSSGSTAYVDLGYNQLGETDYNYSKQYIAQFVQSLQSISGRSYDIVYSNHFFARLYHNEFNYSSNPTWPGSAAQGTNGTGSVTYITTVGLYVTGSTPSEDKLVAIAKLSKPVKKTDTLETIIKIKLDY